MATLEQEIVDSSHGPSRLCVSVITDGSRDSLLACLESLRTQVPEKNFTFECVLIVLNAIPGSVSALHSMLEEWTQRENQVWPNFVIEYEPIAGIPASRNRAIRFCQSRNYDWLAFIDDDSTATSDWLQMLTTCQVNSGASVVAGLARIVPAGDKSPWCPPEQFGDFGYPKSYELSRNSGQLTTAYTRNVLFHIPTVVGQSPANHYFDLRFTNSGGSDVYFFRKAYLRGCKIFFCAQAIITETYAGDRLRLRWHFLRKMRNLGVRLAGERPKGFSLITTTEVWTYLVQPLLRIITLPLLLVFWALRKDLKPQLGRTALLAAPIAGFLLRLFRISLRQY